MNLHIHTINRFIFPTIHPDIPEELQKLTGADRKVFATEQRGTGCASHDVGMAIVDYLDDVGYQADLEEVTEALT